MAFAAPLTVKVALALLIVGLIIFIIGFSTPYWTDHEFRGNIPVYGGNRVYASRRQNARLTLAYVENYMGLWKRCQIHDYTDPFTHNKIHHERCWPIIEESDYSQDMNSDRHRATQFFECIALITSVISFVVFLAWALLDSLKDRRLFPILAAVLALIAGGCAFLGAIIFGTADNITDVLDWSFALAIVGGCFFALAGIIGLVGVFMNK